MIPVFNKALSVFGLKEQKGDAHNKQILEFFEVCGHSWVKTDETAWCSAFANWCCKETGFVYSGELDARSWLQVGIKAITPQIGDLVVFWRESKESWKGHVGFWLNEDEKYIYCLGGNQHNKVCVSKYPKSQLLEYRRIQKIEL